MKKIFALLTAVVFLAGCQSENKEIYSRQIEISTIPEGAPIVVDGLRMGKAPISLGVETTEDGCFVRKTVITAIPQDDKLFTQIITFPAYRKAEPEKSLAPEKIIFDMTKDPQQGGGVITE